MSTFIKQNVALVTGIALPILIVVFFLLASVLPRYFIAAPAYDFLFTHHDYNYDQKDNPDISFTVNNQRIHATVKKDKDGWRNKLYRYERDSKTVREIEVTVRDDMHEGDIIPISDAAHLVLSPKTISPDDYEFVIDKRGGGGFIGELFYNPRRNNIILRKNGNRISIPTPNKTYSNNAKFLGWIIEQENGNE